MREFILKHKQVVLVDDEDYERLSKYRWHGGQYVTTLIEGNCKKMMHRIIMDCTDPSLHVDHRNHNTYDNQKDNLRVCTISQNVTNRKASKNSTSKYLGVSFDKRRSIWRSQITTNKKTYHLGRFKNEVDAAIAYNNAAIKAHGEYANLNVFK